MICFDARSVLPLFAAVLLTGCGGGGNGDPPSTPLADELGACDRLADVSGPATWVDPADTMSDACAAPADKGICVSGSTIVAIDRFDETGAGQLGNFYVQDTSEDPQPFSGMTVFGATFSPPDLRLAEGDVIDMNGLFMEFLGPTGSRFGQCRTLPEVSGTLSFRFDGSRAAVPRIITDAAELKTYEGARPYLGMLVKVLDVTLATAGTNSSGRFTADLAVGGGIPQSDVPRISNELYDIEKDGPPLVQGGVFKSVTGVVTYFYGFKIAPRSPADFES